MALKTFYSEFYPGVGSGVKGTTTPSMTEDRVSQIVGDIGLAIEDSILTRDEKIRILIPTEQELDVTYANLQQQATSLNVSVAVLNSVRSIWKNYLATLTPDWNDTSANTTIDRDEFRTKINEYLAQLAVVQKAATLEAAKRADVDGGLTDNGIPIDRTDVVTEDGIAGGIIGQGSGATANDLAGLNPADKADLDEAKNNAQLALDRVGIPSGTTFPTNPKLNDAFFNTVEQRLYIYNGSEWLSPILGGTEAVTSLPIGLGMSDQGKIVFLKTDNKIYRWTGSAWISSTSASDIVGQIVEAQIADAALTASKFPSNVRPIEVLSSLPSSGNTQGRQVFLTTDSKVYRWNGSAWTTGVAASDIVGTVPSAIPFGPNNPGSGSYDQLFMNTTDKKLYRWNGSAWTTATNGADITAGSIVGDRLAAGTIQAAQIGAKQINVSHLKVIPAGLVSDQYFSDMGPSGSPEGSPYYWSTVYSGGWYKEVRSPSNNCDILGVPSGIALWAGQPGMNPGTGIKYVHTNWMPTPVQAGQTIRLRAAFNNASNQYAFATVQVRNSVTGLVTNIAQVTSPPGSGVQRLEAKGLVPAGYDIWRMLVNNEGGFAFTGAVVMSDFQVDLASSASMIVDGAIQAIHMSADSVSAGAIQAGAVAADKIAANSVGTTKLFVGASAENLVVNNTGREGNAGWSLIEGSGDGVTLTGVTPWYATGRYGFWLTKPATSSLTAWGSRAFPVVPGRKYSVRLFAAGSSSSSSGMYHRMNWRSARPADDVIGDKAGSNQARDGLTDLMGNGPVVGGVVTEYNYIWTAPAGANWASFAVYNWANAPTTIHFADVEVKEQTTGVMIADGAIYANHLTANSVTAGAMAANSVTTNALAAGSVVAGKMSVSDLSAISANVGTITAGLLRNSPGTMQVDLNNSRIVFNNGVTMKVTGNGFGTSNQFIEWSGPSMAINQCSEANAVTYLRTDGRAYFGGSITAGTISNSVRGTSITVPATSTLGPFGTNGNPITIVWSYDYSRDGYRWGNQTPSGSTSALVRLFRSVNGGSETLVDSMSIAGYLNYSYAGEPVPGQPGGTTGRTFFNEYMGNSRTFTDSGGGSGTRTYRIEVFSRTLGTISGGSKAPDNQSQNYGITSSE